MSKKSLIELSIIVIALLTFVYKLWPSLIPLLPFGESDAAHYTEAYDIVFNKSANPVSTDFTSQRVLSFTVDRPYGTYGLTSGYLMFFDDVFIFYKPGFLMAGLLVVISLIAYTFYKGLRSDVFPSLVFAYSLLSFRMYLSWAWGQWAFIPAVPFVLTLVYYYRKWMASGKDSDLFYSAVSLFVGLQVHQYAMLIALTGLVSLLVNELINRRKFSVRKPFLFFGVAIIAQLISLNAYTALFNSNEFVGSIRGGFNLIEAFVMTDGYGYLNWYFTDYFFMFSSSIILLPFGVFYSFKKKDYFLLLWLVLTFIISRPSLIPISHVQVRLAAFTPIIIGMMAVDGIKALNNNKIVLAVALIYLVCNFALSPYEQFNLSAAGIDLFNWISSNLNGAVILPLFKLSYTDTWWANTISHNKVFEPEFNSDGSLVTEYTDLSGNHTVTHFIALNSDPNLFGVPFVYKNSVFMVIAR